MNRPCLSAIELGDLVNTRGAADYLNELANHVEICPACQQNLDSHSPTDVGPSTLERNESHVLDSADRELLRKIRDTFQPLNDEGSERPLPHIPGFMVEARLGEGGYATVFKARQVGLANRVVAVKLLGGNARFLGHDAIARFRTEAEAFAKLDHPNIVQIFAVGEVQGTPYLVLEFIEGGNLQDQFAKTLPSPKKTARLMVTIARAVQFMHDQGIVHRDLKPRNILLAQDDNPKLSDFGLVRFLDAASQHTATNQLIGTREYMSPEQARGHNQSVGPASDIYSLGATLYQMLVGHPPFPAAADDHYELMRRICEDDPLPPRFIQPSIPRDLETICLKCLNKSPSERYPTAAALVEDLERVLEHHPIQARPSGIVRRAAKWSRRHPSSAALIAVSALSIFLFAGTMSLVAQRERELRRHSDQANRQLEDALYANRVALAERYLDMGLPTTAAKYLDKCPENLRRWEWHCLKRATHPSPHRQLPTQLSSVRAVAVSPDGTQLLAAGRNPGLLLVHLPDGSSQALPGFEGQANCAAFSHDGRWMAAAGNTDWAYVWDVREPTSPRILKGHTGDILTIAFSPNSNHIATAGHDDAVRLWDLEDSDRCIELGSHSASVTCLAYHPTQKWLATGSNDQRIKIWNYEERTLEHVLETPGNQVRALAFSPDGKTLAAGGEDRLIHLWSTDNWFQLPSLDGHKGSILSVTFQSPAEVVSAGADTTVRVHDLKLRNQLSVLFGHSRDVKGVAVSPSRHEIVTGSADGTIRLWTWPNAQATRKINTHRGAVLKAVCSPDGRRLASLGRDMKVCLWDVTAANPERELSAVFAEPESLVFHPDSRTLAVLAGHEFQLFHVDSGNPIHPAVELTGRPRCGCFTPDGQAFITSAAFNAETDDCQILAWPVRTTGKPQAIVDRLGTVRDMVFNPTGQCLGVAVDKSVRLIDWPNRTEARTLLAGTANLNCLQFHPNGFELLAGDNEGHLWAWDLRTNAKPRTYQLHTSSIADIVLHPTAPRLFTTGFDGSVKVWSWPECGEVVSLVGHKNYVFSLDISPDGNKLFSASADSTVSIWDGAPLTKSGR